VYKLISAITVPKNFDYGAIKLRVGLEIHQQLDTSSKLFCNCIPSIVDDAILNKSIHIKRFLRATRSELGEIDTAAAFETQRQRIFDYIAPSTASCLVELDEEPPHPLNREALAIAIAVAMALNSMIVDEVHVMRKIVVDGSNTTGFQRTAIIALGGRISDEEGDVGIQTIALEEDAARKISEDSMSVTYSLDRLGIPLIEISTAPDIRSPHHAKRIAEKIGLMLRFTGKAKRGIGTIRQDLNISIAGAPKIEVKGVQKLELIPKVIEEEVRRLVGLLMIRDELVRRGASREEVLNQKYIDVTDILKDSNSKFIRDAINRGGKAYAVKLPKFGGILGVELQTNRRFGTELADYARQWANVKGLIHSDELPEYGIDEDTVIELKKYLEVEPSDAFVIIVDEPKKVFRALEVVKQRAAEAIIGIPKETRGANDDGSTRYLRPQPGAARMYPETDVPPIRIDEEILMEAKKYIPPTVEEKLEQLTKVYGLSQELARQLIHSEYLTLFENVVKIYRIEPKTIATVLTVIMGELRSEGIDVDMISDEKLYILFKLIEDYQLGKDSIKNAIVVLVQNPMITYEDLVNMILSRRISIDEVRQIVRNIVTNNIDEVRKRGSKAFQYIMGKVMSELRGKVDGKQVASIVREELDRVLSS